MRLQHWQDKRDSLTGRLDRLKGLNASDFGRDGRIASMEALLKRLRQRVDQEQVRSC